MCVLLKKKDITSKEIQHFFELNNISIRSLDHIDELKGHVRISVPASEKNLIKIDKNTLELYICSDQHWDGRTCRRAVLWASLGM